MEGHFGINQVKIPRGSHLIIIGSGPTAFGAISRIFSLIDAGLIDDDHIKVTVIEKEETVGGLARSITDSKGFTWDLGIHVLGASNHKNFTEMIGKVVKRWNKVEYMVKADLKRVFNKPNPHDNYVSYPVQQSIPYFPPSVRRRCIEELRALRANDRKTQYANFAEFCSQNFGQTLMDTFIRPYNQKYTKCDRFWVWTVGLEELSARWVLRRVPDIDLAKIEARCQYDRKQLEYEDSVVSKTNFKYPSDMKGIGEIWKHVSQYFPSSIFRLSETIESVDVIQKTVKSSDADMQSKTYKYDYILSTIPITELGRITSLIEHVDLKYSKIILVGIGLRYPQNEFSASFSWAYFPYDDTVFYRCTFPSNFSDHLTPDCDSYWSVLCEIAMNSDAQFDENELINKTIDGLKLKGIITHENSIVDTWMQVLNYGYPIPTVGRDDELIRCHRIFQMHNIYSRGRFGGWKYEISNQDQSFAMGYEFIEYLLFGKNEALYEF